jgi:hypothetical protein
MTFLTPFFLLGLLALAIPVIIHFLNLRKPQKVAFSTLSFFSELQKSTIRRLKLKRWLLLAVRVLALIMLALALARPFLPPGIGGSSASSATLYIILVDNGIRMDRVNADGPYLDQAKELILSMTADARDQDRFAILSTHGDLMATGYLNSSQVSEHVADLQISRSGTLLNQRFKNLDALVSSWSGDLSVIYRITTEEGLVADAQFLEIPESLKKVPLSYVVLGSDSGSNLVVHSVKAAGTIAGPGVSVPIEILVSNLGRQPVYNAFVSLEVDERLVGQQPLNLDPGASETVYFDLIPTRSGFLKGDIVLEGDQFQPDNNHFFSLQVPEVRQVLLINEATESAATYLTAALQAAEQVQGRIRLQRSSSTSYQEAGQPGDADVIVLNGLDRIPDDLQESLVTAVQSGRGLVLLPSPRADFNSYNRLLGRLNAGQFNGFRGSYGSFEAVARVDRLKEGHPIIEEIFEKQEDEDISTELPGLFYYLRYNQDPQAGTITVLQSELSEPILIDHRFGNGRVLISTVGADPGWSSFPGNPLFVPIFYRTILYAMSGDQGEFLSHELGLPFVWSGRLDGDRIVLSDTQTDFYPEVELLRNGSKKVTYPATEWQPGIYQIRTEARNILVAANYNISESDFYTLSDENTFELLTSKAESVQFFGQRDRSLSEVQQELKTAGFGAEIWYWFVIAAISLLIIEMAISRWYKAETIT